MLDLATEETAAEGTGARWGWRADVVVKAGGVLLVIDATWIISTHFRYNFQNKKCLLIV